MKGKIKKINGIFPVTIASGVYLDNSNMTLKQAIDNGGGTKVDPEEVFMVEEEAPSDPFILNTKSNKNTKHIVINEVKGFDPNNISITINKLINDNGDNTTFYLEEGKEYVLTSPIIFNKRQNLILNGNIKVMQDIEYSILIDDPENIPNNSTKKLYINKMITSNNVQAGILILNTYHLELDIGYLFGFGSCISMEPNKNNNTFAQGIQYTNIRFQQLKNSSPEGACILFKPGPNQLPWINENTFTGGRLRGTNGFKSIKGSTQIDPFNNNKFYNIGFEGLSNIGIDGDFMSNNIFSNCRFEAIEGLYIKEFASSQYNSYSSPQPILKSKIQIQGKNTVLDTNLTNQGGAVTSYKMTFNCYNSKDNSVNLGFNIIDRNEEGISYCESDKNLLDRYAMIFKNNSGDKFCLPCRETKVKEINNTDFTMDYLYKDLRILSNEKVVTITIPDIFLYDSAEFNFSTNWNTNDIVFVSESGAEQFRITNSDGLGTWNAIFIPTRGKFSQLKLTDKFRAF